MQIKMTRKLFNKRVDNSRRFYVIAEFFNSSMTCATCQYFNYLPPLTKEGKDGGYCERFPPKGLDGSPDFAITRYYDYCGEYQRGHEYNEQRFKLQRHIESGE